MVVARQQQPNPNVMCITLPYDSAYVCYYNVIKKLYSCWPWYLPEDSHIGQRPQAKSLKPNTKAKMNTVN